MTPIEKQILKNQADIMRHLSRQESYFMIRLSETSTLLNPESNKEEPCCEMPEREEEGKSTFAFKIGKEIEKKFVSSKQDEVKGE